jgi:hypothetical protein
MSDTETHLIRGVFVIIISAMVTRVQSRSTLLMLLLSLSLLAWMCEWNFVLAISIYLSLSNAPSNGINEWIRGTVLWPYGVVVSKYHSIPCSHHTLLLMPLTSRRIFRLKNKIDIEFFMFIKIWVLFYTVCVYIHFEYFDQ